MELLRLSACELRLSPLLLPTALDICATSGAFSSFRALSLPLFFSIAKFCCTFVLAAMSSRQCLCRAQARAVLSLQRALPLTRMEALQGSRTYTSLRRPRKPFAANSIISALSLGSKDSAYAGLALTVNLTLFLELTFSLQDDTPHLQHTMVQWYPACTRFVSLRYAESLILIGHSTDTTIKVPEMAESISEGTLKQWNKSKLRNNS